MKAKEYAELYKGNTREEIIESVSKIGSMFIRECGQLAQIRKVSTDAGTFAILEEQNRKWKALSRMIEGLREDGFEIMLSIEVPILYKAWKGNK